RLTPKSITPYAIGVADLDKDGKMDISSATSNARARSSSTGATAARSASRRFTGVTGRGLSTKSPSGTLMATVGPTSLPLALTPLTPSGLTTGNRVAEKGKKGNSATRPDAKPGTRRRPACRHADASLDGVALFDIVPTVTDLLRESFLPLRAIWHNKDIVRREKA